MSIFLTNEELAQRIGHVTTGKDVRCAVAFWGDRAAESLFGSPTAASEVQIICDISMGASCPNELRTLGAPDNPNLRHQDGLHAKVFMSDRGIVVGSANATHNALGFKQKGIPPLTEAASFHEAGSAVWLDASDWFHKLFKDSARVDATALDHAEQLWKFGGGRETGVRPDSLFDLVSTSPERFTNIGFVFTQDASTQAQRTKARKAAVSLTGDEHLSVWPDDDMFCGWTKGDLRNWPQRFFEFWQPPGRSLAVYARTVGHYEPKTGSVLSASVGAASKRWVAGIAPLSSIAVADGVMAKRIADKFGNHIFPSAFDLRAAMEDRDR
jgi:hypothetical protein